MSPNPELIGFIGFGFTILCLSLAAFSAARTVLANYKLGACLKQNHYQQWSDFLGEDIGDQFRRLALTPLNSEKSYIYFIFKSREDFGDKRVRDYKKQLRYGIYGFFINAIAAVSSFLMTCFILSKISH